MEPQDITYSSHLGVDDIEEGNEASKWIMLQNVNESQEKEDGLVGATAEGEGAKEEFGDEAPAGHAAPVDGRTSSSSQDMGQGGPGSRKGHQALPGPSGRLQGLRHRFTKFQVQELERVFERNHYPSAEARRELARWMGVTESRVQNWLKSRRAKYRKCLRM